MVLCFLVFFSLSFLAGNNSKETTTSSKLIVLHVQDAIGPAISDYIRRGIHHAKLTQADLVLIEMDTPGGLDKSMRDIIKDILDSPIPIITYVSPKGARAASAGTYILYASHIAAMAPMTTLGAATPVSIGTVPKPDRLPVESPLQKNEKKHSKGDITKKTEKIDKTIPTTKTAMEKKVINDAAAYIRGLAQQRNRNISWAEEAVREGVSLSSQEALERNVIDLVADSIPELLRAIDGKKIRMENTQIVLSTQNINLDLFKPDWKTRLLTVITSPEVAYILLLIGVYGLFFEFSNPGFVVPGVLGGISLLLALYAFQMLPINYVGLALIILGISFLLVEVFLPSFGIFGIGGTISFAFGSILLIDSSQNGMAISWQIITLFCLLNLGFFLIVINMAFKAMKMPVITGQEQLVGSEGVVLDRFTGEGMISIQGELWKAYCDSPLEKNQPVTILNVDGLTLHVAPTKEEKQ